MYQDTQLQESIPNPFAKIFDEISEMKHLLKNLLHKESLQKTEDEFITVKDASLLTKYSPPSIYRLCKQKEIPHHKQGNKILFKKDELISWLNDGRQKTVKEITADAERHLGRMGGSVGA
ncbi:MAG: helix-turn-helix domain-containing protein [Ginsengibacter sp.]